MELKSQKRDETNEHKSFFTVFWHTNNSHAIGVLFGVAVVRET